MEENFSLLVKLGEEIGLFIVQEGQNEEYIIGIKDLIKLKKKTVEIRKKDSETFEFIDISGNKVTVSLV